MTPRIAISGVVVAEREHHDGPMKTPSYLKVRPYCRGIEPDSDERGYYCSRCGYNLIETKTGWYRHGIDWQHPEVWWLRR